MASERKQQILEALAQMLEAPKGEKVTTAALAAKLNVSEAALYRHFANKAKMFESLIEFIETSLFGIINKVIYDESDGLKQVEIILLTLLKFAEKNPGMTRVLTGDALVNENPALQLRINQLLDRVETSLKQSIRIHQVTASQKQEAAAIANSLLCFVMGRWQQYAKSQFKRKPLEFAEAQLSYLLQ